MDTELFELCKDVHKRLPEWYAVDTFYVKSFTKKDEHKNALWELESYNAYSEHMTKKEFSESNTVPLYTSDYLLKKLPKHIGTASQSCRLNMSPDVLADADSSDWYASYVTSKGEIYRLQIAATPLKALLKLAIALDKEGVL